MKKRIVSMILALSMMLSILPVSAFADAGAGFSSAAAEETNSITYSSEEEHEAVGKNSETNNQVVKIKTDKDGLPKAAAGTGWSYEETTGLTITGSGNTEYILDGTVSCNVTVKNANSYTVYLLDGTVTGILLIEADNMYGVCVLGGSYADVQLNLGTIDGGTFDSLYCNGSCSITNAVIQSCNFNTYGNNTYTISDTVLGELPDGLQKLLADGQQLSTLVVRNGNVTAMNGRTLPLSTNTIYLVGAGSAELTLNTDVLSINEAPVSSYNANTSADGKVLRITGNNDGAEIFVNKSTDLSDLKPLRITKEGLPDLTGVTGVPVSGEGMTANLYEGLGWKYATMEENGRTRTALYVTTPDGNPVNLASGAINENQVPIAVEQITFANVTVTSIVAEGSVGAQNTIIQDGTFRKDVYMDENSTIAGGSFYDVVRAYGTITGGSFIAEVQLNQNSEVTGGVFHDVQLPSHATEKTVIRDAVILGSLKTYSDSKAAISNTVSCGYIESRFLAAGQQQSKLMMTDGTVEGLNDYAAATDTIYLVGNTAVTLTFSTKVTNINGEDVSAYNGAQLSPDGKTLTLTAKNDGEPIVVNMAATGKLPFSSLKESNFKFEETMGDLIITCDQEGVGELSLVCVRTDNNAELDHIPSQTEYGSYKIYIEATEGERYTAGRVLITEEPIVRKYRPTIGNFSLDLDAGTATYNGPKYFGNVLPQATLKYSATNDFSTATETVPTEAGTYYVWLVVENSQYYYGSNDQLPDGYTVAEKLPFEGFTMDDFKVDMDNDGNYTVVCKTADGVGELSTKLECLTGVNKGKTFINREPDEGLYGRYQGSIVAKEGKKYKAGSIVVVEDSIRYTPEAKDFAYDATTNKVKYNGKNYYDADPDMTLLYGIDQSETVPTAPGSHDVYVKVTADGNYLEDYMGDKTYQVGTYVVPEPTKPTSYTLTVDGVDEPRVFDENVTVTAPEKDGYTFTGWEVTGLPADVDTTKATISFTMPANNVTLKPQYEKNTYTLTVDGVDEPRVFDENVTVTAPEKDGYTFTGWEVTGLSADVDTTKATISFTMPANNVTLKAQYTENAPETYELKVTDAKVTLKDGGAVADLTAVRVGTELVATASGKDGYTFTGWEVAGLSADVDTTKATITFKMPANDVEISAIYNKVPTPDPDPETKTHKLNVLSAQIFLKDGGAVADLTAVPVGTELKATADEDTETSVFKNWNCTGLELTEEQSTARVVYFTMPDHDVELTAVFEVPATPDPDPTPDPKPDPTPDPAPSDDGGAIVMVAAVGGAAIGVGAYIAGTTAYLKSVLPEGMAIPANRQQLAVALWTAAGKPATQSTALFNDVAADAAELQAIHWVVETGLMTAQDGSFKPGSRVGRMEVIRTWKAYQQRG